MHSHVSKNIPDSQQLLENSLAQLHLGRSEKGEQREAGTGKEEQVGLRGVRGVRGAADGKSSQGTDSPQHPPPRGPRVCLKADPLWSL